MKTVFLLASKEFLQHLRNGWVLFLASAFTLFALVISVAGFGFTGTVGALESEAALRSITSLVMYLIPLLGLLLGYDAIAGERERGTLDLLRTYPLSAEQMALGKLAGLGGVLALTLAAGLATPALVALRAGGNVSWLVWPAFWALGAWLGLIFIALALWLSTLARERGAVLAMALALWLVLVLLFDLAIIGLLVATEGALSGTLVQGMFLLNPASLFRVAILAMLGGNAALEAGLGEGEMAWGGLWAALVAWTVLPVALAVWRLRRLE